MNHRSPSNFLLKSMQQAVRAKKKAIASHNKDVSAKRKKKPLKNDRVKGKQKSRDRREFRRRLLREAGSDASAAADKEGKASAAAGKEEKASAAAGKEEKAAGKANRGAKATSLQANLLLELLKNKESARRVVALYLALVSEVSAIQQKNKKKQKCMCITHQVY